MAYLNNLSDLLNTIKTFVSNISFKSKINPEYSSENNTNEKQKRVIATEDCYGTQLPESGEEGQIFFLIDNSNNNSNNNS